MSDVKHKIIRVGEGYQVQRRFDAGNYEAWITKRKGYPDTPGEFVKYRFLNEAIKCIRAEEDGKKSEIVLSPEAKKYLERINFTEENLQILLENPVKEDAPTAIS